MIEINSGLPEYKRELVEKKNEIISDIESQIATNILPENEVGLAINEAIKIRLNPIGEKYRKTVEKEARLGFLKLASEKIRSALIPKKNTAQQPSSPEENASNDISNNEFIEQSATYGRINKELALYSSVSGVINSITDKIRNQAAYTSQQVVLDFLPLINVFPDSNTVQINGTTMDNVSLLKEIANAILENRDPSNNSSPQKKEQIFPIIRSAFKKIGVRDASFSDAVLKNTNRVEEMLCKGFLTLAPQFDKTSLRSSGFKFFNDIAIFAKLEQEKSSQNLKNLSEKKSTALNLLGELDVVLDGFEIKLNQDNIFELKAGESPNISEKKQEELLKELRENILPVLTKYNQSVYKPAQDKRLRLSRISETLEVIDNLKQSANPNKNHLNSLVKTLESLGVNFDLNNDAKAKKIEIDNEIKLVSDDLDAYATITSLANEKKLAFIKKFGLDSYLDSLRSAENLEKVDPWRIYFYLRDREIPFWTSLHHDSDDEFDKKLVYFVKYQWGGEGKGWESAGSRLGLAEDWWASEEGRMIMGMLQTVALRGKLTHGAPYAEGKKEELFTALKECHLDRGPLYEKTVGHPVIGPLLTAVLDIYRRLPTLKLGKLPPEEYLQDRDRLRSIMKSDAHFNKFLPRLAGGINRLKKLDERFVIRNVGGKDRKVKLAGDRVIKNSDGKYLFLPGDEMLAGDKEYLNADANSSYQHLVGSNGKVESPVLVERALELARKYPKRFGLKNKDLLNAADDEKYESAVVAIAVDLTYAFPYLTDIYAQLTEETLTSAHPVNTSDYNWHKIFNFLGFMIHDALRYGKPSPETWALIHGNELADGIFGPSGIPDEINDRRKALIHYDEFKFGSEAMKHVVGKMGDLSQFTNALKMLQISLTEERVEVRLAEKKIPGGGQYDGYSHAKTIYLGKEDGVNAMGWDLYNLSSKAFLKFMDLVNGSIKDDSISFEDLMKDDGPVWDMLSKVMGQFKMWGFGEEDDPDNVMMHMSGALAYYFFRVARAVNKTHEIPTINEEIFEYITTSIMKATGLIVGNIASEGEVGLTKGQVFKVATGALQILMGIDPEMNTVSIQKLLSGQHPTPGSLDSNLYHHASTVRFVFSPREVEKKSISQGFAPVPAVDRAGITELIPIFGKMIPVWKFPRRKQKEQALRTLWELERKVNPEIGEWPFLFFGQTGGDFGAYVCEEKLLEPFKFAKTGSFKAVVDQFEDMLYGRRKMRAPLARPKYGLSGKH